jgi:hypothetical protein
MTHDQLAAREPEHTQPRRHGARARDWAALGTLMAQRDDLRGAYAFADHLDEAVRWSA